MSGWIAVDFDGTMSVYPDSDWNGLEHIGKPVPLMINRIKDWLNRGIEVRVFTARAHHSNPRLEEDTQLIHAWCEEHVGQKLTVTCMKDFEMIELWDDRAVGVKMNTGERIG